MRTLIALMMVVFSTMSVSVAMADRHTTKEIDEVFWDIYYIPPQPEFPGGQEALMEWIEQNKVYPQEAIDKGIEGRVIVKFTVEEDGTVTNGKIVRGVDPLLDKEALRLVSIMPKWKPGMNNGEVVRCFFTLPITFKL
ncbi:MAG: energy transducer TonB [Muribaculaceae bacterium]|nr:energy transducer TonB [Muribaculaceae bacterium]